MLPESSDGFAHCSFENAWVFLSYIWWALQIEQNLKCMEHINELHASTAHLLLDGQNTTVCQEQWITKKIQHGFE